MNIKNLSINKLSISISVLLITFSFYTAFKNISIQNNKLNLDISNDIIIVTPKDKLEYSKINENDTILEISVCNKLELSNGSLKVPAKVERVISGELDTNYLELYISTPVFNSDDKNYFTVYYNNIFIPGEKYYVIVNKMNYKTWYMSESSYKLKDDISIFTSNTKYKLLDNQDQYKIKDLHNINYFFRTKEELKIYENRKSEVESYFK